MPKKPKTRGEKIEQSIDREARGSSQNSPGRRHYAAPHKDRGTTYVDPKKYRKGSKGEKSYGAPMGTQNERNKRRKKGK